MIVGGYCLHIYCDVILEAYDHEHSRTFMPAEYTGHNMFQTERLAKKDGWKISKSLNLCICPKCWTAGKRWSACHGKESSESS